MISIIISSYKEDYYKQVIINIKDTIGVAYEVVKIQNPGLYSIAEAYNMGAAKAKYDILCFMHEDLCFQTINWGERLINHFSTVSNLGLLGVAGSIYKTALPTGWFHYKSDYNKVHMVQHEKDGSKTPNSTYTDNILDTVKTLDGVFLATTKAIWNEFKFSTDLKGYHLYDIDFSLRIGQKYRVAVGYDIMLEHFSKGVYTNGWLKDTIDYHRNNQHLFNPDEGDVHLIRTCWYYFLIQGNEISFSSRWQYVRELGIDLKSMPFALTFLFPSIMKPIFFSLVKMKQNITTGNNVL